MRHYILAAVAAAFLSACGSNTPAPAAPVTAAELEARLLETYTAKIVNKPANKGNASLSFTARSLTGKTFTDENLLVLAAGNGNVNAFGSDVLLGKDGKLYVYGGYQQYKGDIATTKPRELEGWFAVGTHTATAPYNVGQAVKFKTTGGNKVKMNWKGINPMGEDFMIFQFGRDVEPVANAPAIVKL